MDTESVGTDGKGAWQTVQGIWSALPENLRNPLLTIIFGSIVIAGVLWYRQGLKKGALSFLWEKTTPLIGLYTGCFFVAWLPVWMIEQVSQRA